MKTSKDDWYLDLDNIKILLEVTIIKEDILEKVISKIRIQIFLDQEYILMSKNNLEEFTKVKEVVYKKVRKIEKLRTK